MINIKDHLRSTGEIVEDLLDKKAELLWVHLNDRKDKRQESITCNAQKFAAEVNSDGYVEKYKQPAATRHGQFMDHILKSGTLKKIITAKPADFESLKNELRSFLDDADFKSPDKEKTHRPFANLLLDKVFKYKNYRNSSFCTDLYLELNFLQATCPYCNEYPVKIVQRVGQKAKKSMLHFDLDHFYPQDLHPYFALSFYNHIPSCKYCNSLHKLDKSFSIDTHIHPFARSFDETYAFQFSHKAIIGKPVDDVSIAKKPQAQDDKLCEDLELEERYKNNLGYANINRLIEILSDYAHLLGEETGGNEREFLLLKQRLTDFGLQLDGHKILERPWSKMQRDLVKFIDVHNLLSMRN